VETLVIEPAAATMRGTLAKSRKWRLGSLFVAPTAYHNRRRQGPLRCTKDSQRRR
jgi:hypothetical protein